MRLKPKGFMMRVNRCVFWYEFLKSIALPISVSHESGARKMRDGRIPYRAIRDSSANLSVVCGMRAELATRRARIYTRIHHMFRTAVAKTGNLCAFWYSRPRFFSVSYREYITGEWRQQRRADNFCGAATTSSHGTHGGLSLCYSNKFEPLIP